MIKLGSLIVTTPSTANLLKLQNCHSWLCWGISSSDGHLRHSLSQSLENFSSESEKENQGETVRLMLSRGAISYTSPRFASLTKLQFQEIHSDTRVQKYPAKSCPSFCRSSTFWLSVNPAFLWIISCPSENTQIQIFYSSRHESTRTHNIAQSQQFYAAFEYSSLSCQHRTCPKGIQCLVNSGIISKSHRN